MNSDFLFALMFFCLIEELRKFVIPETYVEARIRTDKVIENLGQKSFKSMDKMFVLNEIISIIENLIFITFLFSSNRIYIVLAIYFFASKIILTIFFSKSIKISTIIKNHLSAEEIRMSTWTLIVPILVIISRSRFL